jgi:hypothetical protein
VYLLACRVGDTIPTPKAFMTQEKEHVDARERLHTKALEIIEVVT